VGPLRVEGPRPAELMTRALVVDDSRTVRVSLRKILETVEGSDFEVEEAADGAEALKFMEKRPTHRLPDIILLDRNMPRMSGDACIRILKSDPVWKTIPVIFLTAQADKAELVKGLTLLGGDDYLAKPFDAGEMIARVKALVRAKKAEDQNRALTHNLERALEAQRKAYEELKTTKINLAETQAVAMMTRVFEKFVPKQFLQRIALDGLESLKPGNVLASRITILFSDLRSFTTISEGMTAKDLFALLNEYLAQMQGPIDHFGGFVDKFIGDAIMALFDQESSAQAEAAVNAAIGMQRRLLEWNHKRKGPPAFPIASGIGIHTGMVMLGTLGSTTRMDSTVIGDAVNLASRLEGLTKQFGVRIIVSGDTLAFLDRSVFESRELDLVSVKGRAAPVAIHELFKDLEGEALDRARRLAEAFAPALGSYRRREWAEAIAGFLACLELVPGDVAAALLLKRSDHFRNNPPTDDWDGSFTMDRK
jgi:adenylate cyclase